MSTSKAPSLGGIGRAYQAGLGEPYAKKPPLIVGARSGAAWKMWKQGQRDGRKSVPSELLSRAADVGITEPSREWLRAEAQYVVGMIQQGGCDYNDSPDSGRKLLTDCERFVRESKS